MPRLVQLVGVLLLAALCRHAEGLGPCIPKTLEDAWWTGPVAAPSAAVLPHGHFLIEPYVSDGIVRGRYDTTGKKLDAPFANQLGGLLYALYGVRDNLTTGLIYTIGYDHLTRGSSTSVEGGDLTLLIQSNLVHPRPCRSIPTISLNVQESFPTGRYDRLGSNLHDGFGTGAFTNTVGLYSQTYFWMPGGRALRARLNVSNGWSSGVSVHGVSVYGTPEGFAGHAEPGQALIVDLAAEYSVSRKWVVASDLVYHHNANTRVFSSSNASQGLTSGYSADLGWSQSTAIVPAVEYSWKSTLGVVWGAKLVVSGHNTSMTMGPVVAINYVH